MRVAIIGGGAIARLLLQHVQRSGADGFQVVAIAGRSPGSRGAALAREYDVPFVTDLPGIVALAPDAVVEAASHAWVRESAETLLAQGIAVIVLSCGALADDALRARLEAAARSGRTRLYVPSGGIGGLDALKAACAAGVDTVEIIVRKPAPAWRGIPYVDTLGLDLDHLDGETVLFEGPARAGVPLFPANVNIAAALSMAGVGFDRTRLKVVADPALQRNTHSIRVCGASGTIDIRFESVPFPENPKTAMLAAYSALAAVREFASPVRYGT